MPKATKQRPARDHLVVTVKPLSYQPNAKELRQDLRVDAPFEEALGSLVKPVKVKKESEKELDAY